MRVYIADTITKLNKYIQWIKDSSRINTICSVGFDVEMTNDINKCNWCPNPIIPIPCIIQVAVEDLCVIINLPKIGKNLPNSLNKLITSQSWVKFGVGIENDLRVLSKNYNLGHCGGAIELQNIAIMSNIAKPNLSALYSIYNTAINNEVHSGSDWTGELSNDQLNYAVLDALMSYRLGINILSPSIKTIKELNLKNNIIIEFPEINDKQPTDNYIGILQEYSQKNNLSFPVYLEIKNGSQFTYQCSLNKLTVIGDGALNKRDAKQQSAKTYFNKYLQ